MVNVSWARGLLIISLAVFAQFSYAQVDPVDIRALMSKVSDAMSTSNYHGRLTYEYSGKLEIIEIAHTVVDGVEHDRVSYLNGPERGLVKNSVAGCLNQGRTLMKGGKIRLPDGLYSQLESTYSFKFLGSERVAGRDSWVLQVVPKDAYRHSIILAVDKVSYLPTKTLFVSSASKVLERLHFVALEIKEEIGEGDTEHASAIETGGSADDDLANKQEECPPSKALAEGSDWQPQWVPPGFVLASYEYSDTDGHMETYTDGLVSFSVFTKEVDRTEGAGDTEVGASNYKKGATAVIMRLVNNIAPYPIHVAVLGEIPAETASRILSSVNSTDS